MKKKALGLLLMITLAAGFVGGCSDSGSSDSPSKFVGLWHMSLAGNPSDPGLDWRFNTDQTTIVLYNTGSTSPKGSGTCAISGQNSSGTWAIGSNAGRFTATLTSDDTMDFNFIEDSYSPPKTVVYVGSRLE